MTGTLPRVRRIAANLSGRPPNAHSVRYKKKAGPKAGSRKTGKRLRRLRHRDVDALQRHVSGSVDHRDGERIDPAAASARAFRPKIDREITGDFPVGTCIA